MLEHIPTPKQHPKTENAIIATKNQGKIRLQFLLLKDLLQVLALKSCKADQRLSRPT